MICEIAQETAKTVDRLSVIIHEKSCCAVNFTFSEMYFKCYYN